MKKETVKKFFEFLRGKEEKSSFLADLQIGVDLAPYRGMEWEEGELDLSYTEVKELPENLTVHGDLYLTQTPIQHLPSGLKIFGELVLTESQIQEIPEDLWAETVQLSGTQHPVRIPKNPKFFHLKVNHTTEIIFPEGFTLRSTLWCQRTDLTSLPSNMTIGSFQAAGARLKKLPENLTVSRNLDISTTQVDSIPRNLKIGGDLLIVGTPLVNTFMRGMNIQKSVFELSPEEVRKVQLGIKQEIESKNGYTRGRIII